jgi:dolichol-phosphate mannosyltransferase
VPDPHASASEHGPKLLISLATYNEAGNLKPLVETIRRFARESSILVIDDNSPDGTGRIADELRASLPNVDVIHRPGKLGLGTQSTITLSTCSTSTPISATLPASFPSCSREWPTTM